MVKHGPDSIELRRVLLGRKDRETFHWFLDFIATNVVGVAKIEQVKAMELPHKWLPASLEAYCLLCVENNFVKMQMDVNGDTTGQPKWTRDARGKKKNQGWAKEGISRYNHLVQMVRLERETLKFEDTLYMNKKKGIDQKWKWRD